MLENNFTYDVGYDTIGNTDCENNGCDQEGICRCYTIDHVDIYNVDFESVSKNIFNQIFDSKSTEFKRDNKIDLVLYGDKDINRYCIDRLLVINKIYDKNNWRAHWSSGYYGQEVDKISINSKIFSKLESSISKVISLESLKDKVEFLLIEEYGHILDKIKDKEYKIIEVDKSDIVFTQEEYKNKIETEPYYSDKDYNMYRGVCLFDGVKWRVIDGYHRLSSTKMKKVKIIGII